MRQPAAAIAKEDNNDPDIAATTLRGGVNISPKLSLSDGRLGLHLQAEGASDFTDAGEAGGGVVGRFVALDLLLIETQPFGQFFLAKAGGDAGLDQSLRLHPEGDASH